MLLLKINQLSLTFLYQVDPPDYCFWYMFMILAPFNRLVYYAHVRSEKFYIIRVQMFIITFKMKSIDAHSNISGTFSQNLEKKIHANLYKQKVTHKQSIIH